MQKYTLSELQNLEQPILDVWYTNDKTNEAKHAEKITSIDDQAVVFADHSIDSI